MLWEHKIIIKRKATKRMLRQKKSNFPDHHTYLLMLEVQGMEIIQQGGIKLF